MFTGLEGVDVGSSPQSLECGHPESSATEMLMSSLAMVYRPWALPRF